VVLDPGALTGVRLGVVRTEPADADRPRLDVYETALASLRAAGAVLVDVTMPAEAHEDELAVLHHEFAPAVAAYLAALGPARPGVRWPRSRPGTASTPTWR